LGWTESVLAFRQLEKFEENITAAANANL